MIVLSFLGGARASRLSNLAAALSLAVMLKLLYSQRVAAWKAFLISWVQTFRNEVGATIDACPLRFDKMKGEALDLALSHVL